MACGNSSRGTPAEGLGTLSATDLGVGSVVRLTLELPPTVPTPAGVLILRREDGVPQGPADPQATTVYRGPLQAEYFDAAVTPNHTCHYAAYLLDGDTPRARGPETQVEVGPRPVTGLVVTDPGLGRRLELSWTGSATETMDLVRIVRFVSTCAADPDPAEFDRRVDLPVEGPGRTQAWFDDQVVDGVTYCYAVFTRSHANYLYSPGAYASGRSTDATPPGAVSRLRALPSVTPGDRSVALSWTNPQDPDLARVLVLRQAVADPRSPDEPAARVVWNGPGEGCRDPEVLDGVEYRYRAWAMDGVPLVAAPADTKVVRSPFDDDGDGFREDQGDCDDADDRVHPDARSLDCSQTDWDCDGTGWEDAFCRSSVPPWLDEQCSDRAPAPACVAELGCDWHVRPDHAPCSVGTEPDYSFDICVAGACRSPGTCGDATCNSPGPHFPLPPDAGHTDLTRTGDAEPLVTDGVTGLMWQGCPAGLGGRDCTTGTRGSFDWPQALAWCDELVWGGHDDWHLPDRYELLSIVDHGRVGPASDPTLFPETSDFFWSSSSYSAGSLLVWLAYFNSGNISYSAREAPQFVRCVRDGTAAPAAPAGWKRFRRAEPTPGQPLVTDLVTGLAWQGCAAGLGGHDCLAGTAAMLDWTTAMASCDALVWSGFSDWRLPDAKELDSILDTNRRSPAIDPQAFPATPVGWYWAASPYAGGPTTHAWHVSFSSGHVANFDKVLPCYVRCVRSALP